MVKIECTECNWQEETEHTELKMYCPDCGSKVISKTNPEEPETTKSDKI